MDAQTSGRLCRLVVIEAGGRALHALRRGDGEICAAFRRSVYLRAGDGSLACLGDAGLGRGPLNARVADSCAWHALAVGDRVELDLGGAQAWQPAPCARRVPPRAALQGNLASLQRAAAGAVPRQGLGPALIGAATMLVRDARPALVALDGWLDQGGAPPLRARRLLGLGPGLTPSGDDYLAGMLLALRATGRAADADALWNGLHAVAPRRTHPISHAHLAAAAAGEACEAVQQCVAALCGDAPVRWPLLLRQLGTVGHCSGWDALAGAAAVARAALRAH